MMRLSGPKFISTPVPRFGPPGYRRVAFILKTLAWVTFVGLLLPALVFVVFLGVLGVVMLVSASGAGKVFVFLLLAFFLVVLLLVLPTMAGQLVSLFLISKVYVSWVERKPGAWTGAFAVAVVAIVLGVAVLAFAGILFFLGPIDETLGVAAPTGVSSLLPLGSGIAILANLGNPALRTWMNAPPPSMAQPAATQGPATTAGPKTVFYSCPRCDRRYQLLRLPATGTVCPTCKRGWA